jgi:glycosyltransferase involved in cell wall biosynthesis
LDIGDLADKILKIVGDAEILHRLSQNAAAYASKFDWDRSAREFEEVLESL